MTIQEYLIYKAYSGEDLSDKEMQVYKHLATISPERDKLLHKIYRMKSDLDAMRTIIKRQFM
jgi:hypothetical protein